MTETRSNIEDKITTNDKLFTGWHVALSQTAKTLVQQVITQAQAYEVEHSLRQRKRRPNDQDTFEATVGAVISELIEQVLREDDRGLAITRSNTVLGKRSVYRPPALNKALPDILDVLERSGWLKQATGFNRPNPFAKGQRTLLWPSVKLLQAIEEHGLTLSDIGGSPAEQCVILKTVKEDYWHKGDRVEYLDTPEVKRIREQVQTINTWLAQADIEVDEDELSGDQLVNSSDRTVRRYFSQGSFESGGRLFGGFWQPLSKEDRLRAIRIDGEQVVCIDYGQIGPRILYGLAEAEPPRDDLYDLPYLGSYDPSRYRPGIKKVSNAMTFADGPLKVKPRDTAKLLPPSLTIHQIAGYIKAANPEIASLFGTKIGHNVQLIESEVMIDVLLRLEHDGIVALPVHDCLIVPQSAEERAATVMLEVFKEKVGVGITVSKETGTRPMSYDRRFNEEEVTSHLSL